MAQPLSFTIISQDDTSILSFVDMTTGQSGNLPQWSSLDEKSQNTIMDIIKDPESVDGDAIKAIYDAASNYNSNAIQEIRRKLGIKVGLDNIYIGSIVLPKTFQKLLGNVETLEEAQSIVAFAKDLENNPGEHCKEALIEWLVANPSLSFAPDGRIIGYRAVDDKFLSYHSGYGIVNGEEFSNSKLDNTPGNVLQFPRFMVDQNTDKHCSIGLHVGTWKYASTFGHQKHISVAFKASDVVSPPSDAYQEKIRVSEFTVLEEITEPYHDTIVVGKTY